MTTKSSSFQLPNVAHFSFSGDFGGREKVTVQLDRALTAHNVPSNLFIVLESRVGTTRIQKLLDLLDREDACCKFFTTTNRFSYSVLREVSSALLASNIQVLHCHCYKSLANALCMRLCGLYNGAITYTLHGLVLSTSVKNALLQFGHRLLLTRIDGIIGCSHEILCSHKLPSNTLKQVIVNAIHCSDDEAGHRPARKQEAKAITATKFNFDQNSLLVANVGRLCPQKNFSLYLKLLRRLLDTDPVASRIVFLIVGQGELYETLQEEASKLELQEHIRFTGFVSDMATLYAASDILVQTSTWEGTPMCLLEAMCHGLPIVAPAVGGNPDVVIHGETGFLYPQGELDALLPAVREYIHSPKLRQAHGDAGFSHVRTNFSVSEWAQQHIDFYQQALAARKSS